MTTTESFCVPCSRTVFLSEGDDRSCPVCSTTLMSHQELESRSAAEVPMLSPARLQLDSSDGARDE
jgi:ribosomal protein S27AE